MNRRWLDWKPLLASWKKAILPLDESLKIFEEGIRLSKNCLKILEEAEHKVEVLVQDKNGKKRIHAYSPDDEADERPPDDLGFWILTPSTTLLSSLPSDLHGLQPRELTKNDWTVCW